MERFGPNSTEVADFLNDVRSASRDVWRSHVSAPRIPREVKKRAWDAVGKVPLPASVHSAIGKSCLDAFRGTGLNSESFPGYEARSMAILSEIELACTAIAAGGKLADEHARTLLEPFARLGFGAAVDELSRRATS